MVSSSPAPAAAAPPQVQASSVEMDNLGVAGLTAPTQSLDPAPRPHDADTTAGGQQTDGAADTAATTSSPPPNQDIISDLRPTTTATSTTAPRDALTRKESEALGPATDAPIVPPTASGPALSITLMLTTGARHPYKIDEKYLRNRKVEPSTLQGSDGTFEPRELSGYKLKELIWTDWRGEWEPRPASPSSIRLIILGRFIEDKTALKDLPFKMDDTNVVHMTVKPADFVDEEENMGKGTGKGHSIRGRDDGEGGAGCRCVIL